MSEQVDAILARLRAPEAEVWVRLRPPTMRERVGRELETGAPDYPEEFLRLCEFIVDANAEATWDDDSRTIRSAAEQLVEMVGPVLDDPEETSRRIDAWAEEWSVR